jgi:hypothetical protein
MRMNRILANYLPMKLCVVFIPLLLIQCSDEQIALSVSDCNTAAFILDSAAKTAQFVLAACPQLDGVHLEIDDRSGGSSAAAETASDGSALSPRFQASIDDEVVVTFTRDDSSAAYCYRVRAGVAAPGGCQP